MKKLLVVLLSITLMAVLFSGCGKSDNVASESKSLIEEATAGEMSQVNTGRPAFSISGGEAQEDGYSVVIHSYDQSRKLELIRFFRENLGLNLADAKTLAEDLPASIINISEDRATELAEQLLEFDCVVDILDPEGNVTYDSIQSMIEDTLNYDIIIKSAGTCPTVQFIAYIRDHLDLDLKGAKNFYENLPQTLYSGITGAELRAILNELTELGIVATFTEN